MKRDEDLKKLDVEDRQRRTNEDEEKKKNEGDENRKRWIKISRIIRKSNSQVTKW